MIADENLKKDKDDETESEKYLGCRCQNLVVNWTFVTWLSLRTPIT